MNITMYSRVMVLTAATLALAACAAPYHNQYGHTVSDAQPPNGSVTAAPMYYRGTLGGSEMVNNNDAAINANVINAVASVPGSQAANIQVSTVDGNVSLRGAVDNKTVAQNAVQAARQVPGVRSVTYDLRLM